MKKAELQDRLEEFCGRRGLMKGARPFGLFLVKYLDELDTPDDRPDNLWYIDDYIPQIVVGAVRMLSGPRNGYVSLFQEEYLAETGEPFMDPTAASASIVQSTVRIIMIADLVSAATDDDLLRVKMFELLNAERHAIELGFYRFLDEVMYRGGLHKIITDCKSRGMSGQFGTTTMYSHVMAGRMFLTFAKGNVIAGDQQLSFVCSDTDPLGLGAGLKSCNVDLATALAMIEEVRNNWNDDPQAYKADKRIAVI